MTINKYKGKRINGEGWIYGYLIGNDIIVGDIIEFNDEYFNTEYWYKVEPETIGQYTGIKEIYGGDVLPPDDQWGQETVICYDTLQACYKRVPLELYKTNAGNGGWTGMSLRWHSPMPIGNIHDDQHNQLHSNQ